MIEIGRKAWCIMAEHQLTKRIEGFGDEANVCKGCQEILMCSGPISFQICQTVDEMLSTGLLKGPKKIYPFKKTRRKFLPIDGECLNKYGFTRDGQRMEAQNETT